MTPEEAREHLAWPEGKDQNGEFVALCGPDGADALRTWDGDLYASGVHGTDADKALAAAAPALAAMRAGMREEWGVAYTGVNHGGRYIDWDPETREEAETMARRYRRREGMSPVTIVRRYVTTPEEA